MVLRVVSTRNPRRPFRGLSELGVVFVIHVDVPLLVVDVTFFLEGFDDGVLLLTK